MNEDVLNSSKIEWEKPSIIVLDIIFTQFNCLKFGEFNDLEDSNCPRS